MAYGLGFAKAGRGRPARTQEAASMIEKNQSRRKTGVALVCDGREIPLNPFVRRFIEETVTGMVRALEGIPEEPRRIDLRIRRK